MSSRRRHRRLFLLFHFSFSSVLCVRSWFSSFQTNLYVLRSICESKRKEVVFIQLIVTNWNPFNLLWNLSISNKIEAKILNFICIVLLWLGAQSLVENCYDFSFLFEDLFRSKNKGKRVENKIAPLMCVCVFAFESINEHGIRIHFYFQNKSDWAPRLPQKSTTPTTICAPESTVFKWI